MTVSSQQAYTKFLGSNNALCTDSGFFRLVPIIKSLRQYTTNILLGFFGW